MSDFWVLVKKEIMNFIRDKKFFFGLIIVFFVFYFVLGKMMQVGIEQVQKEIYVVIVNFDDGKYGEFLIWVFNVILNVMVIVISVFLLEEVFEKVLVME